MAVPRPWNEGGHAIVQAAFAVDCVQPLIPPTIRDLLSLHPKVSGKYPRKQEMTLGAIGIAANEATGEVQLATGSEPQLGGFTFDSLRPNGEIERSITLAGNKFSVTRTDYES